MPKLTSKVCPFCGSTEPYHCHAGNYACRMDEDFGHADASTNEEYRVEDSKLRAQISCLKARRLGMDRHTLRANVNVVYIENMIQLLLEEVVRATPNGKQWVGAPACNSYNLVFDTREEALQSLRAWYWQKVRMGRAE